MTASEYSDAIYLRFRIAWRRRLYMHWVPKSHVVSADFLPLSSRLLVHTR
jgi:hypothetical protein